MASVAAGLTDESQTMLKVMFETTLMRSWRGTARSGAHRHGDTTVLRRDPCPARSLRVGGSGVEVDGGAGTNPKVFLAATPLRLGRDRGAEGSDSAGVATVKCVRST